MEIRDTGPGLKVTASGTFEVEDATNYLCTDGHYCPPGAFLLWPDETPAPPGWTIVDPKIQALKSGQIKLVLIQRSV